MRSLTTRLSRSCLTLPILSAVLIGTSYIPSYPWAIFFAFVPLWAEWLRAGRGSKVFWTGWLTQFIFTPFGSYWMAHTVHEFGHLPWAFAVLVMLAYSAISTLYLPVSGYIWFLFSRRFALGLGARILALPVFVALGHRVVPMLFDWHFGYSWLWARWPAYHLADVVGFVGLADIGLGLNALFLAAFLAYRAKKPAWPWVVGAVSSFALLNVLGLWREAGLAVPDTHRKFLLVQANIDNEEKLYAERGPAFRDVVIQRFMRLTEEGLKENPGVDFAVWPETAFPDSIDTPDLRGPYDSKLRARVGALGVKLITGAYSHDAATRRPTNSFFVLGRDGRWLDRPYHKTILLAFGEYFPFADWFPILRAWYPEVADFGRGPGPTVIAAEGVRIGAQICYEGLFDWFSRGLAARGAEVMVNLTNDSWYGPGPEPYQHAWMTIGRAVETRRPLVRATNTGISTVALASGQILERSPTFEPWQHAYDVAYVSNPRPTPFTGWGYWLVPALLAVTLAGLPLIPRSHDESGLGRDT